MAIAAARQIPRMLVVNKIDEVNADIEGLVAQIRESFGVMCLPINLPKPDKSGVINVFEHDGHDSAGDQTDFSSVHEAHKNIVEQVIEVDEELTMEYLEKGEGAGFDPEKLHAAFEKALGEAHLVPICFMSARSGVGAEDLLHIFASLCPSPLEVNPPEFLYRAGEGGEEADWHAKPDHDGKLVAHVFRTTNDPFLGKIGIFRVHQGSIKAKHDVIIDDQKKPIKIGHLFLIQGKEHIEVPEVGAGAIAAVIGILAGFFLLVLGFLWYPFKKLIRWIRSKK